MKDDQNETNEGIRRRRRRKKRKRVENNAQYYRRVLKKEKYTRKIFWSKSLKKVKVQKWCQNGSNSII